MTLSQIHAQLSDTATLFIGILAVWALLSRIRRSELTGAWFGAAVIGEMLIIAQGLLGGYLYTLGLGVMLTRPLIHILYGAVAVITLPAAYGYFGHLEDEQAKSLAMALVCAFLWGILQRTAFVSHTSGIF
jgi:heme A synthase